ncbi:hypothetical protein WR25_03534 [Diploscapter pachys]|uniref:PXA domain-containing protein n=1 Tax=Diploscapter pachys TaxID=2018661 RepID=A0A2A2JCI5_9BILA|nr:hypothetical protein WR25_03534 [Diploscapter pachys]
MVKTTRSDHSKGSKSNSNRSATEIQPTSPIRSPTSVTSPLPTEDVHLPGPHPARGIYGFALYISAWSLLIVYLFWAFVPTPVLNQLGITYVPAKLWAIAVPLLLPVLAALFVLSIFILNLYNFKGYKIFEDVESGEINKRLLEAERMLMEVDYQMKEAEKDWVPDSLLSENLIRNDTARFGKILDRREREKEKVRDEFERLTSKEEGKRHSFPLEDTINVQTIGQEGTDFQENEINLEESASLNTVDRGFYVDTENYVDEYVAGSTRDLANDDVTMPTRMHFNYDDAVEEIEFQLPHQSHGHPDADHLVPKRKKRKVKTLKVDDELEGELRMTDEEYEKMSLVGTVDPERPATNMHCAGCGAQLHCKDSSLPGFLPLEVLEKVEHTRNRFKTPQSLCRRCHLLKHHNFLLNVNVCDVDYKSMMSHLQLKEEALIVLVVDITDMPGSIHSQLPEIIGDRKPMIVVANKIDLLPPDAEFGYMKRCKQTVERAVAKQGLTERFNIIHTALISAKTGFGIEELITEIFLKYTNVKLGIRSDVYLIGCTNAGKSTLFNALLQSDLCKVRALDLIERATTSVWPGTTISLLKFPVMKPTPFRLELRRRRLLMKRAWKAKEERLQKLLLSQTGDVQFAVPVDTIQNSFKEREEGLRVPTDKEAMQGKDEEEEEEGEESSQGTKVWNANDPVFKGGKWCYDTPGTVNDQQCLSLFTLDELIRVLPRKIIRPRTALLNVGQSLLIGGVARIDINEAGKSGKVLLTTFASADLPLNIMPTSEVESFLEKYLGKMVLSVPCGNEERMSKWPGLKPRKLTFKGMKGKGCNDVILSSVGWCMVTTSEKAVKLTAYSPDGRGLTSRLAMHPYAADLKGKRIPGAQFYSNAYSRLTTMDSGDLTKVGGACVGGLILLLTAGVSVSTIIGAVACLLAGSQLAQWLCSPANRSYVTSGCEWLISKYFEASGEKPEKRPKTGASPVKSGRTLPWEDLSLPSELNEALEFLLEQIVEEYVNNWYEGGISHDRDFLNEIRYQLRFACANLLQELRTLDLPEIVASEALPALALHFEKIIRAEESLTETKTCPKSVLEAKLCEKYADFHFAMKSRQNELNYLRGICDLLIPRLLDESRLAGRAHDNDDSPSKFGKTKAQRPWPSHSARHFLRELLSNAVLQPVLDLTADPDYINQLLILLVDTLSSKEPILEDWKTSPEVTFLKGLSEQMTDSVPDSLLQLKLSEILRDARQYSMFQLYLKDVRGPTNELTFLAEATRIHESMQKKVIELSKSPQEFEVLDERETETADQISYDVWQLYGQFVHESAPDRIRLPDEILDQFSQAVQSNDTLVLDTFQTFQFIYTRLQTDFVIPFCQSESFLGYLCGSPPISVNELIEMPAAINRKTTISEKSFSLAQLRWRVQKALTMSSTDSLSDEMSADESMLDPIKLPSETGFYHGEITVSSSNQSQSEDPAVLDDLVLRSRAQSAFDRAASEGRALEGQQNLESSESVPSVSLVESKSMPLFVVSSIDVSVNDEASLATEYSPRNDLLSDEDVHMQGSQGGQPILLIDEMTKNINQWRVEVSALVPVQDIAGKVSFVFSIDVERMEARSDETKKWSIYRNFNEFYVLETKLLEFHKESIRFVPLPIRKSFVTKDRVFLEQHRLIFSAFIASLCKQRVLKRSDLMSAFLTIPDEFRDTLQLSDLNPWKVVKRMPSKLSRERGQNLQPFLLNILAKTLAPPTFEKRDDATERQSIKDNSENCRSLLDSLILLASVLSPPSWLMALIAMIRKLGSTTIDKLVLSNLRRLQDLIVEEPTLVMLVRNIQRALFYTEAFCPTEQEKSLRAELVRTKIVDYGLEQLPAEMMRFLDAQNFRDSVRRLLATLQHPRLNKQALLLLLDILLAHLFEKNRISSV